MASLGHVAVGLLAGRILKPTSLGAATKPMLVFASLSLLPDLDYIGVALGVPDAGPCGHRGAAHSLIPALVIGVAAFLSAKSLSLPRWRIATLAWLVVASHSLLDAMTVGSRGVPILWPFSFWRFEMPWRPIPDAPCGLAYLSLKGLHVASIEFLQFLPILGIALRPTNPPKVPASSTPSRRPRLLPLRRLNTPKRVAFGVLAHRVKRPAPK